jgi:GMP synthase (glutamine-hydrolysing)
VQLTEAGKKDLLLNGLPDEFRAFGGHKESCQTIPPQSTVLAKSESCPIHMVRVKNNIYAAQFHPELDTEGLAVRINVYRHAGYFPPEEADSLIALSKHEDVFVPEQIFKRFIDRYVN